MASTTFINESFNPSVKEMPFEAKKIIEEPSIPSQSEHKPSHIKVSRARFSSILMGLVLSIFIATLDNTIIATALGNITSDLEAFDEITWVATSYLLSSTAFKPLYGKFSDIFGRRPTIIFALSIFMIGSILCGAAQNIIMLIVARAIAGIGGGGLISLSTIIISDIVSLEKRGLYMGMIGAISAVASVVGPLLGGILTEKVSWRWCFYINIPICIAAIGVIAFCLKLPQEHQSAKEKLARVDYLGTISLLIFTVLLVLGLNWGGQQYSWNSAAVISSLVLGCVFLLIFIFFQWKVSKEPIIPSRVLVRSVILADLIAFFNGAVFLSTVIHLPLYYQIVHGDSAIQAGLELLPTMLGVVSCSISSGIFVVKTGIYRPLAWIGTAIGLVGMTLMGSLMRVDISRAELIVFSLLIGIGIGSCIQINIIISQAAVPGPDAAIVTSLASFSQSLGSVFGIAILGTVYQNTLMSSIRSKSIDIDLDKLLESSSYLLSLSDEVKKQVIECYVNGFKMSFLAGIAFFSVSFIAALFLKHNPLKAKA